MKKLILLLLIMISSLDANIASAWLYGKAAASGQQADWGQAQACMNQLIVDNPDQPDLLYDSGIAAYHLLEFDKAAAYFDNVTKLSQASPLLKKQAYFNLGNTNVALKQLPQAITAYEQVLALEPDNEPAKHNLAKVKEMLKQQQQKQQQQNKQNNQNNKNEKNDTSSQDQNNQGSSDDADTQDKQNGDKSSNNANKSTNQQQSQQSKNENDAASSRGKQEKEQGTNKQQEGQQNGESNNESNEQNREQEQNEFRDSHASSSGQQAKQQEQKRTSHGRSQPTKNGSKEQESQKGELAQSPNDKHEQSLEQQLGSHEQWMAKVLKQQEKADKTAQKVLVKTNINKQLAGQNGQNCW